MRCSNTFAWIQDFLSRRTQQVTFEGVSSTAAPVTYPVFPGYRVIRTPQDAKILQEDIDKLQYLENKWLMEFNADNPEVLRISNNRKNHETPYTIHCHTGPDPHQERREPRLHPDPNMSWNAHINMTTRKANNTLAFLRRSLYSRPKQTEETCYKSLVRPRLEYASTVWDPPTKSNINALEMVQRRAARFVSGNYRRQASVASGQ